MNQSKFSFFEPKISVLGLAFFCIVILFGIFQVPDILDTRLFYTETEALLFLENLSPEDSRRYFHTLIVDLFFIPTYVSLLFLSLGRLFWKKYQLRYLALVPGLFDFFETGLILNYLWTGTTLSAFSYLGYLTAFKWISLLGLILLLLIFFPRSRSSSRDRHLGNQ